MLLHVFIWVGLWISPFTTLVVAVVAVAASSATTVTVSTASIIYYSYSYHYDYRVTTTTTATTIITTATTVLHDKTYLHPKPPTPRDIINLGKCVHRSWPLQCWQEGTGSRWKSSTAGQHWRGGVGGYQFGQVNYVAGWRCVTGYGSMRERQSDRERKGAREREVCYRV